MLRLSNEESSYVYVVVETRQEEQDNKTSIVILFKYFAKRWRREEGMSEEG